MKKSLYAICVFVSTMLVGCTKPSDETILKSIREKPVVEKIESVFPEKTENQQVIDRMYTMYKEHVKTTSVNDTQLIYLATKDLVQKRTLDAREIYGWKWIMTMPCDIKKP